MGTAGCGLRSIHEHREALSSGGLVIEREQDLTSGLLAAVRHGFQELLKTLPEIRQLAEPARSQYLVALVSQLDRWGKLYAAAEAGVINATAILAGKPQQ